MKKFCDTALQMKRCKNSKIHSKIVFNFYTWTDTCSQFTCFVHIHCVQWNLSNTDTLGTKIIFLISDVSLFQGENNIKLGLSQVSWLTRCPFQQCPWDVPLHTDQYHQPVTTTNWLHAVENDAIWLTQNTTIFGSLCLIQQCMWWIKWLY